MKVLSPTGSSRRQQPETFHHTYSPGIGLKAPFIVLSNDQRGCRMSHPRLTTISANFSLFLDRESFWKVLGVGELSRTPSKTSLTILYSRSPALSQFRPSLVGISLITMLWPFEPPPALSEDLTVALLGPTSTPPAHKIIRVSDANNSY